MGFKYQLRWADGEQIRINGNQLVRVRAVIPVKLAAEFVDGAVYGTLEIEPVEWTARPLTPRCSSTSPMTSASGRKNYANGCVLRSNGDG
jgi:hypothetical protein